MNKTQVRIFSSILSFSMILSTTTGVFAQSEPTSGPAEISFSASKYVVTENGTMSILWTKKVEILC